MHDYGIFVGGWAGITKCFKTVNGKEACTTLDSVRVNRSRLSARCFKTVNGKEACTTVALPKGVATPRNSDFWKEILKSPLFDCVLRKSYQMSFIKGLKMLI